MKKTIFAISAFIAVFFACNTSETIQAQDSSTNEVTDELSSVLKADFEENTKLDEVGESGKIIQITTAEFKELIYDYTQHPETWVYKGTKPCVIDFYADWCRPCKMIEPILTELAATYKDDVIFYKVNIDQERELSQVFQIRNIPLVVFSPLNSNPEGSLGVLSKEEYIQKIDTLLLQKK
ncbi:MAG: thioredoxin domain-containing protein [Bacteroidales bacterium]|nr:thioredoxin domain-containing protein [Bacteroidales bacterium]NLK80678.1 redoxin domain-containing protein [Bacteroidales bacterium]HPY81841.1 thioredoxin domain-containing protein [Bacteroidales bacterium]